MDILPVWLLCLEPVHVGRRGMELVPEDALEVLLGRGPGYLGYHLEILGQALSVQALLQAPEHPAGIYGRPRRGHHRCHDVALARRPGGGGYAVHAHVRHLGKVGQGLLHVLGLYEVSVPPEAAALAEIEVEPAVFVPVAPVAGAEQPAPGLLLGCLLPARGLHLHRVLLLRHHELADLTGSCYHTGPGVTTEGTWLLTPAPRACHYLPSFSGVRRMGLKALGDNTKLIVIGVAVVFGFIFILQNFEQTSFQFLIWTLFSAPKWIVVSGTFVLGFAFGFLLGKKKG